MMMGYLPAALTALVMLAFVPLIIRVSERLTHALNRDWRGAVLEWVEAAQLTVDQAAPLEIAPDPEVPALGRVMAWVLGGYVAALTAIWVAQHPGAFVAHGFAIALGAGLLLAIFVDLRVQLLPDCVLWPLAGLGALASVLGYGIASHLALLGALAGGGSLYLVAWVYRLLRGRDGLGMGDVKLIGLAGLWMGWMPLPWVVFAGSMIGIAFYMALNRGDTERPMPFGPALACGILLVRVVF